MHLYGARHGFRCLWALLYVRSTLVLALTGLYPFQHPCDALQTWPSNPALFKNSFTYHTVSCTPVNFQECFEFIGKRLGCRSIQCPPVGGQSVTALPQLSVWLPVHRTCS